MTLFLPHKLCNVPEWLDVDFSYFSTVFYDSPRDKQEHDGKSQPEQLSLSWDLKCIPHRIPE
jgi:hypothetical protein